MIRIILLAIALVVAAGTIQKDPIFKGNFIVRDKSGAWVEYWIKDPLIDGRWIRYKKNKKVGSILKDPIFADRWLIFDSDPVGE